MFVVRYLVDIECRDGSVVLVRTATKQITAPAVRDEIVVAQIEGEDPITALVTGRTWYIDKEYYDIRAGRIFGRRRPLTADAVLIAALANGWHIVGDIQRA